MDRDAGSVKQQHRAPACEPEHEVALSSFLSLVLVPVSSSGQTKAYSRWRLDVRTSTSGQAMMKEIK